VKHDQGDRVSFWSGEPGLLFGGARLEGRAPFIETPGLRPA